MESISEDKAWELKFEGVAKSALEESYKGIFLSKKGNPFPANPREWIRATHACMSQFYDKHLLLPHLLMVSFYQVAVMVMITISWMLVDFSW